MRISFVIQDLVGAGAQYVTALLVRGFIARGYNVDLVVSAVHTRLVEQEGEKPFVVPTKTNWIILPHEKARDNVYALWHYLRTTDSRAIIAMSPNYTEALGLAAWGVWRQLPLVHVEHSSTIYRKPKGGLWKQLLMWLIFYKYRNIIGVSKGTTQAFAEHHPMLHVPITTIYNPVVDEVFYEKLNAGVLPHPWLRKKQCPTFVAAAAHTPFKNHWLLFDAIQRCQKIRKIRLVLFGAGALTQSYRDYIKEHNLDELIDLAGFANNLPTEMKHADGFLISSNEESFSVVLVEALACGVPVISTNCPFGPPEILENGKYGTLVPVGDAEAMANAILEVAAGKHVKVPDSAWKKFSLENVVAAYERALGLL